MNVNVGCGCGRTMNLDSLRGPGAYRCGCGARVKVTPQATSGDARCGATGCRAAAATGTGIPKLCADHDKEHLREVLPRVLAAYPPHTWIEAFAKSGAPGPDWAVARSEEFLPGQFDPEARLVPPGAVVYFLRVGDKVKIGTALNLVARMENLNPPPGSEVMLTVPGSYGFEAQMHRQFAADRHGGTEWFELSPTLAEFIAARAPAQPPWTRATKSSRRVSDS